MCRVAATTALLYERDSTRFSDNVLTMQRFIGANSHGLSSDTPLNRARIINRYSLCMIYDIVFCGYSGC